MEQPEGFQVEGHEDKFYLLKKALYGLKQALKVWYSKINEYLCSLDYARSPNEHTLYVRELDDGMIMVSLYVDDLLVTGNNLDQVKQFKEAMHNEFEMIDLREMAYFLGMEIGQSPNGIFVC